MSVSSLCVVAVSLSWWPWSLPIQSLSSSLSLPSSSVVICLTFSPCPFLLSCLLRCLYSFFTSLCIAPWSPSSSIRSPCSLPLFSTFWVTSSVLYGIPRDVSVISRSLISKSSSWQRTRHAEEHRHKAWRQLMRPHTPTATITRPLQHQVSSQLCLVRWTVGKPHMNNCSWM